jgi:hypothetical protein
MMQSECDAFIERYRVKGGNTYDAKTRKVKVPVTWGGVPESCLKVRDLEMAGVKILQESFMTGIILPMEIIGVIWQDMHPTDRLDINNFIIDLLALVPPRYIHIISGLHRTTGLQGCHRVYPRKPLYMFLYLTLLIVPRSHQHIQTLIFIGNSDNKKSQTVVKTSQWSVVAQYRRQLEMFQADSTLSGPEAAAAFSAYKVRTAPQIPFEKNTLHTFSAVASCDASVFALMTQIFAGQYVVNKDLKGQKKPEAVTHFTAMSGIPANLLCDWMQRVLDGVWLTSQFMKRCKIYTKNERVSAQVLEYIQTTRPKYSFSSLNDVAKVFDTVSDAGWFDAVVSSCEEAVKSKLSQHAQKMIDDMITDTEAKANQPKVRTVFIIHFVGVTLF